MVSKAERLASRIVLLRIKHERQQIRPTRVFLGSEAYLLMKMYSKELYVREVPGGVQEYMLGMQLHEVCTDPWLVAVGTAEPDCV